MKNSQGRPASTYLHFFTARLHFLLLDDLGTKVPLDRLDGFELSWLIETSPANYQGGVILAEPLTDGTAAVHLLNAVIDSGLVPVAS